MIKKILTHTILGVIIFFGVPHSGYTAQTLTDWQYADSSYANGILGGVSVTFFASSNTIDQGILEGFIGYSNPSIYDPAVTSTEAISFLGERRTTGFDYTVSFDSPVEDPVIYIASLASVLTFDQNISLTKISGEKVFTVTGNTVSGVLVDNKSLPNNDANGIVQLNGVFTNFSFNALWDYPTGNSVDGIAMQIGGKPVQGYAPNLCRLIRMSYDVECSGFADWVRVHGEIESYDAEPLCAMVLSNGQHMFTCGLSQGRYDLTVPVDENGQVTVFGFVDGFQPHREIVTAPECGL